MLRHTQSDSPLDVVFEAEEDLYQSPAKQILMLKGSTRSVTLSKNGRSFQSYVNEFCGMLGLASNTLKLYIDPQRSKEVNPHKIVNTPCVVKVSHTTEFHNAPNNSLKPALRSILEEGHCSDISLVLKNKTFAAHKCILTARSQRFAQVIQQDTKDIKIPQVSHNLTQIILCCRKTIRLLRSY